MKKIRPNSAYSDAEVYRLLAFVREECGGFLTYEGALRIAEELGKKHTSIIAKAQSLGVAYVRRESGECLNEETLDWEVARLEMESKWREQELGSWWFVLSEEHQHHHRQSQRAIPNEWLFSPEEVADQRSAIIKGLESNFIETLNLELRRASLFGRFRERWRHTVAELETRFAELGRSKEYEQRFLYFRSKVEEARSKPVAALFDWKEREPRLMPQTIGARRQFRLRQQKLLDAYLAYEKRVQAMPEDELDSQIFELEDAFHSVRRLREWFANFEELVVSVADQPQPNEGENEPTIRLIQHDFVQTTKRLLPLLRLFEELRSFSFRSGLGNLIRSISFFESDLTTLYRSRASGKAREDAFHRFTGALEKVVRHEKRVVRRLTTSSLEASPDATLRRAEWEEFLYLQAMNTDDAITRFNGLRPVLRQCPEWHACLRQFQGTLKQRREADPEFAGSDDELRSVEEFVATMTERVEAEIDLDIEFQSRLQALASADRQLDLIKEVSQTLKQQRESDPTGNAAAMIELKREFVERIPSVTRGIRLDG